MVPIYCVLAFFPRSKLVSASFEQRQAEAECFGVHATPCCAVPPHAPPLMRVAALLPPPRAQAKAILNSALLPLAFGVGYALLAWQAWQGGSLALVEAAVRAAQPWPDTASLAAMFQDGTLAALAWMHLLLLDFLTAR